jgi:hypothetical protein
MELVLIVTTAVSTMLAVAMGVFAWRLAREERRRSAARVAALASDLRDADTYRDRAVVGIRSEPARIHSVAHSVASRPIDVDSIDLGRARGAAPDAELFRTLPAGRSRSTLLRVLVVGGLAVATALALVVATGRGGAAVAEPTPPQSSQSAKAADAVPLELLALGHDRDGDRILVRGVVRNPSSGAAVDQLTAVVFLFDRDGGFLESGRAAMRVPTLAPGTESAFVITIDRGARVGRYRVSFRSGDRVIPHVDHRSPDPAAQVK